VVVAGRHRSGEGWGGRGGGDLQEGAKGCRASGGGGGRGKRWGRQDRPSLTASAYGYGKWRGYKEWAEVVLGGGLEGKRYEKSDQGKEASLWTLGS